METTSIEKQIKDIEDEIFKTQKNKATEHHIGKLKAKLAQLRDTLEKRKSSGAKGKGFAVKKSGDATIGIIGFPNIGKSTLLNQLTDAKSRVGDYEFTTLETIPGMMKYNGADIQLLDLPGLITGAAHGKGRGREILSAIRNVDMILLMIDGQHPEHLDLMEKELYDASLRINQKKPDVVVAKRGQGGITVNTTTKLTHLNENVIKAISSEYVINADITIRDDITEDQLIDVFIENRIYVPALVIINKKDLLSEKEIQSKLAYIKQKGWNVIAISAKDRVGLDNLRKTIFSGLNLIRIYMKPVGKQADYNEPMILKNGDTIDDVCKKLHRDFKRKFRYASVSGPSVKHAIQKVGLEHVLQEGDVLTIVTYK